MRHLLLALGFVVALAPGGCGDDDADTAKDQVPVGTLKTERSTTCLAMQKAACDFKSDKCSAQSRAECDTLFQSLYCKSDAAAQACIDAIAKADCSQSGGGVAECDPNTISDKENAKANCRGLATELCNLRRRCNANDAGDACQKEVEEQQKCDVVIGNSPNFDKCLNELRSASCSYQPSANCDAVNVVGATP